MQTEFREKHAQKMAAKAELKAKAPVVAAPTTVLPARDPLNELKIESELKRLVRENIQHHRSIGTWRGKRHGMRLPVRGQRTKTNAKTAKRLNHPGRYSTNN